MKKYLSFALALVLAVVLAACGNEKSDGDKQTLTVGASNVPHSEILKKAKPILKDKGINLKIVKYQDYIMPNKALDEGELDANYFQHIPYLELQMKENGYKFANAGGIHIEPIGVYSKKYKSLEKLPKGAEIIMSSSVADHGRILSLFESKGLIKLKNGVDKTKATVADIVENKKNLKFKSDIEASLLPKIYENNEGDAVVINSNYAIDAGLNPVKDSIALEGPNSPYVNIIAVKKGDENRKDIKTLVEVLHSKKIQDFIKKEYKGAVLPVSK